MTDAELLTQHRTDQSGDQPFAELVRRNVGWVHGAARRRLRDSHLADDVAQAVFLLLHKKSPQFTTDRALVAWLHRTTWYASEVAARQQRRRRHHETEAAMLRHENIDPRSHNDPQWDELAPLLDRLIERLGRRDREAVLLRYYRQMSYADVASAMQSTEEAARKRVDRALDKLRGWATSKGHPVSADLLAAGMESEIGGAAAVAPAGLIAAATGAALAGHGSAITASSLPIAKGAMTMMTLAKAKIAAGVVLASMITVGTAAIVAAHLPAPTPTPLSSPAEGQDADAKADYAKLAPYDAIRWTDDNSPQIHVDGTWYDWQALDDIEVSKIIAFTRDNYKADQVKMRIGEDLVEVLTKMGHAPGPTVNLKVQTLDSKKSTDLKDVPMTHEKRQAVFRARLEDDKKKP